MLLPCWATTVMHADYARKREAATLRSMRRMLDRERERRLRRAVELFAAWPAPRDAGHRED